MTALARILQNQVSCNLERTNVSSCKEKNIGKSQMIYCDSSTGEPTITPWDGYPHLSESSASLGTWGFGSLDKPVWWIVEETEQNFAGPAKEDTLDSSDSWRQCDEVDGYYSCNKSMQPIGATVVVEKQNDKNSALTQYSREELTEIGYIEQDKIVKMLKALKSELKAKEEPKT